MRKLYKNINIPYHFFDRNSFQMYYIYNNKKYYDLNLLFNDYLGSYLTYHFKINGEIKEVHNLSDIANYLIEDYKTFEIPDEYKDEYTEREYKELYYIKKNLLENKSKETNSFYRPVSFKKFFRNPKDYLSYLEFKKYKELSIPKKVYSKVLKRDVYVLYGEFFNNAMNALDALFGVSFYYQFNGDRIEDSYNHSHEHEFESVVKCIFSQFDEFIIYDFQKQFFSKQELIFINKLLKKLKKDKFTSIYYKNSNDYFQKSINEYRYLKDNKKYLKLFIHNIKHYFKGKELEKDIINSHKTKKD